MKRNLFMEWLFGSKDERPQYNTYAKKHLKDVKAGDLIRIEWYRIKGRIGFVKCLNNDPETKKILIEATWNNYIEMGVPEREQAIFSYDDKEVRDFNLLNQMVDIVVDEQDEDGFDLAILQKEMNKAIESEDYERASVLQQKIDNLIKRE